MDPIKPLTIAATNSLDVSFIRLIMICPPRQAVLAVLAHSDSDRF